MHIFRSVTIHLLQILFSKGTHSTDTTVGTSPVTYSRIGLLYINSQDFTNPLPNSGYLHRGDETRPIGDLTFHQVLLIRWEIDGDQVISAVWTQSIYSSPTLWVFTVVSTCDYL